MEALTKISSGSTTKEPLSGGPPAPLLTAVYDPDEEAHIAAEEAVAEEAAAEEEVAEEEEEEEEEEDSAKSNVDRPGAEAIIPTPNPSLSPPNPRLNPNHPPSEAPSTWMCELNEESQPYPPEVNLLIDMAYRGGEQTVTVDMFDAEYEIDFDSMTQRNTATDHKRNITREAAPVPEGTVTAEEATANKESPAAEAPDTSSPDPHGTPSDTVALERTASAIMNDEDFVMKLLGDMPGVNQEAIMTEMFPGRASQTPPVSRTPPRGGSSEPTMEASEETMLTPEEAMMTPVVEGPLSLPRVDTGVSQGTLMTKPQSTPKPDKPTL